jgi:FkbM family methyltransferase
VAKVIRKLAVGVRDQLRDFIESGPLELLALKTQDWLHPPTSAVLAERRDLALMRQICRCKLTEISNCIDIGANIGRVTRMFTQIAPRGTHHAFEPIPRLASRLDRRFQQVHVHHMALGHQTGEVTFFQQIRNHPQSSLKAPQEHDDDVEPITIAIARLDEVIDSSLRIDLIKIDVEGAEYQVLQGAAATIERSRPYIIFEYGPGAMETFAISPGMIHSLLTQRFALQIRTLEGLLANAPALDATAFAQVCVAGKVWNFVASPG